MVREKSCQFPEIVSGEGEWEDGEDGGIGEIISI